jgi:hypothetical protein
MKKLRGLGIFLEGPKSECPPSTSLKVGTSSCWDNFEIGSSSWRHFEAPKYHMSRTLEYPLRSKRAKNVVTFGLSVIE